MGEAVWFGSASLLLWAGFVLVAFHLSAVLYEEPRLVAQFGEEYRAYRQRVRRWF